MAAGSTGARKVTDLPIIHLNSACILEAKTSFEVEKELTKSNLDLLLMKVLSILNQLLLRKRETYQ